MTINKAKTKELVLCRPHPAKFDMPDPLDWIFQERATKLLGVIFTGKLSWQLSKKVSVYFIDFVMTLCSQRVYLSKLLWSQGLPIQQLLWSLWHYCLVLFTHSQSGDGISPDSYKNSLMLFWNGLESLVFVTQIVT